jgi:murein DD-endopeptidase MepM/ murein hydrolase activator NlpD
MITSARGRVLLGLTIAIASLAALLWVLQRRWRYEESKVSAVGNRSRPSISVADKSSPVPIASAPETPWPSTSPPQTGPNIDPTLLPEIGQTPDPSSIPDGFIGKLKLIIPVAGVRPDQLNDTFTDARSEGRLHDAIDIPAPLGTPVFAAADGEIIRLFQSERGGTTIYQLSADKKLIFYYAHLQRYADGLSPGKLARQGETIAYVGDTGNAGAGNYHLHFSISIIANPNRYWEGTNINPYPLLRR